MEENATNKQVLIDEVIAKLRHFTKLYGIDSLFIAGGYCRSLYQGRVWETNDIDVASAFPDQARQLGGLFASEVVNTTPRFYERTGTALVEYRSEMGIIKVEFQGSSTSAYMHNQEVKEWFHSRGIKDVPLMNNIYGRDFTMNSLLYSLDNGELYDPTGLAKKDLDRKLIVSLLPAPMLIKYNPLVILRAIRFTLQHGFYIDARLRTAMKDGKDQLMSSLSMERIMKEITRILRLGGPKGLDALKKYNLDDILLRPELKKYVDIESK